jgi:uncharacterized protein (DUF488 family)
MTCGNPHECWTKLSRPNQPLYTLGHSNHPIDRFIALLRRHGVETVADVRSRPYSRFVPHFGKERLARILGEEGLGYLFLGQQLGGKPVRDDPAQARLEYQARIEEPSFRQGIEMLLGAAAERRIALVCRERDPLDCHRLHLICRYLRPIALDIRHILPDGEVEAQQATERRLLERAGEAEMPLFQPAEEGEDEQALARAYDAWWRRGR